MENKDKLIEDLRYVKRIIEDSKNLVVDNGIGFIIWGLIIIVGLLGTYIDIVLSGTQFSLEIWIILILGGWLYSLYKWYINRDRKKRTTFAGRIMSATWLASGIAMTIIGFIGTYSGAYKSVYISPIIAVILGIAFYVSSFLYENKLMKFIAPLWWLGSIYMFFFPGIHTILVMVFLMLFLQVIPGIILYKKYKREQVEIG
ncbi:MAG: hypothetical protein COW08_07305 [Ignavibacteriales bacterium CG12_big_fil_rev_8_21_14_0_65_30_8]|nr:MAG: hypothetical protein COW08_07305 [Ignavibacteriales bacterium CG12_big_fil_rev_8_21_14_0_65_30_8]